MIGVILNDDQRMHELIKLDDCYPINEVCDILNVDSLIFPILGDDYLGYLYHTKIKIDDIINNIGNVKKIFIGKLNEKYVLKLKKYCQVYSYLDDDYFIYNNSMLTISALFKHMLYQLDKPIFKYKFLIMGYGNLAKLITKALDGFNVLYEVYSPRDIKNLLIDNKNISSSFSGYDIIVNTIPKNIIDESLYYLINNSIIYDLASYPYGFDESKIKVSILSGLPSRFFQYESAMLIYEICVKFLK